MWFCCFATGRPPLSHPNRCLGEVRQDRPHEPWELDESPAPLGSPSSPAVQAPGLSQPTYPPEPPMGPQRFAAYGPKQTAMHEPWEFTRRVRPLGRIPVCSCRAGRHQYSQRLPAQLTLSRPCLSPSLSRPLVLVLVLVPSSCSSPSSGPIFQIILHSHFSAFSSSSSSSPHGGTGGQPESPSHRVTGEPE